MGCIAALNGGPLAILTVIQGIAACPAPHVFRRLVKGINSRVHGVSHVFRKIEYFNDFDPKTAKSRQKATRTKKSLAKINKNIARPRQLFGTSMCFARVSHVFRTRFGKSNISTISIQNTAKSRQKATRTKKSLAKVNKNMARPRKCVGKSTCFARVSLRTCFRKSSISWFSLQKLLISPKSYTN